MYSLHKWTLRNPLWAKFLYFIAVLVFFTESSFTQSKFYFQAGLLLLVYGIGVRPFIKLIGYDLKKKTGKKILSPNIPPNHNLAPPLMEDHWEKTLLLSGGWLFLLIPLKLAVVDTLDLWVYQGQGVLGWKILLFWVMVAGIFYTSVRSLRKRQPHIGRMMAWSLFKNSLLFLIIPLGGLLFIPSFLLLFYYF